MASSFAATAASIALCAALLLARASLVVRAGQLPVGTVVMFESASCPAGMTPVRYQSKMRRNRGARRNAHSKLTLPSAPSPR